MYCKRLIDKYLLEWASRDTRKPLLLRGARQVGKSTAVQELAKRFETFVEINFEKQPQYKALFKDDLDVMHIPADTRSAFPVISVHSPVSIQCRWQS